MDKGGFVYEMHVSTDDRNVSDRKEAIIEKEMLAECKKALRKYQKEKNDSKPV